MRSLRSSNHIRINQFDVKSSLEGLEEKFRIYNEDPLADALNERLNLLDKYPSKWTPEILYLLLQLSDRPVEKSNIHSLELLREQDPESPPPLLWKDLVAEDPLLQDESIWQNVDFGAESSDEEFLDSRSEISEVTEATSSSITEEPLRRKLESYLVNTSDNQGLSRLREAQFWQIDLIHEEVSEARRKLISELDAIRDVVFMFCGLPCSLFEMVPGEIPKLKPSKLYSIRHSSTVAFDTLLEAFATQGSNILCLRSWTKRQQTVPLVQVFQSSILNRLDRFDSYLSDIQHRLLSPSEDVVISLIQLQQDLQLHTRFLEQLSDITTQLGREQYAHAFRYLELLYESTCMAQATGDDERYKFIGQVFFECLGVYLRPIREWMEKGELIKGDAAFFISDTDHHIEPASIWESRFKLRQTQDGVLHAPKFLHPASQRIFNTGKSVVILKYLNKMVSRGAAEETSEPVLDFDSVCEQEDQHLVPFAEVFNAAFAAWIESKHNFASSNLRKQLFHSYDLRRALNAMTHIYFMADGTLSSQFTSSIFDKLDSLDPTWNDKFTVTELAESTLGSPEFIGSDRLRAHILATPRRYRDVAKCRRTVKTLASIGLKYTLSWPTQIIVTQSTVGSYQKIFTFLLQIRRSSHILCRQRLVKDLLTFSSSSDERSLHYSLRMRLLWFSQTLYYYITYLVIGKGVRKLHEDLAHADDIDAMIKVHQTFIKSMIDQALLGSRLELIHKTVLTILDLSIKLEDARASNEASQKEAIEQRQKMADISYASLGLQTPGKNQLNRKVTWKRQDRKKSDEDDEDSDDEEVDIDLSILSTTYEEQDVSYTERLWSIKSEMDRSIRFVVSGLKGVARASGAEESKSWDLLGEMLHTETSPGSSQ